MFEMVKEFHTVFGVKVASEPDTGCPTLLEFRRELITEEYLEVLAELFPGYDGHEDPPPPDPVKLAKELCDLLYVVLGTGVSLGLDLEKCFKEVHRSNMSKLDSDGNVIRREDGKVLKSELYSPADLKPILFPNGD